MAQILTLPDHGRLLVSTDLQGNLRDFERMADLFRAAMIETEGHAYLLFTGDLIHGPHMEPSEWPDFLGAYYRDDSGGVVDGLMALQVRFPGHAFSLLGNHEHAHVGGPHTAKFAADEVVLLESALGPARSGRLRDFLRTLPLVAIAPCGVVFTHGAPAAEIDSRTEVEAASIDVVVASPLDIFHVPVIGPLLWARSAPQWVARRFLRGMGGKVAVFGHDVVPEGYERIGDEQMILSTSFGVEDVNKFYLDIDLSRTYDTVHHLRDGFEVLPLYPDEDMIQRSRVRAG